MTQPRSTGSTVEPVWTIGRLLDWTAGRLADRGLEFPRLDAEVLLAHALSCRRIDLYTRYNETALPETRQRFRELIRRRLEGCPVAYLVGRKEFFSLPFEVTPAVLIPRPESEFIVVECLRLARGLAQPRVLDVGTGSGCLAVTVARQLPNAQVTAIDLQTDALAVARRNADRLGVDQRIRFLHGDLFAPLNPDEKFDLILSNPPYVAHDELSALPAGVRDYEPIAALDGGTGGFQVFDRLIAGAATHLEPGGWLIVEIAAPQEAQARAKLAAASALELTPTVLDGSGFPRVLVARRRPPRTTMNGNPSSSSCG